MKVGMLSHGVHSHRTHYVAFLVAPDSGSFPFLGKMSLTLINVNLL